jgi:hypothetical protein
LQQTNKKQDNERQMINHQTTVNLLTS